MTKYEQLIIKAEKEGAEVIELDFGTFKKCGKCIDNLLIINSNISDLDKYEILAEELAHYRKTHGNIVDQTKIENKKQEIVARRESYDLLVEPWDIIEAMKNGARDIYDMSDYINVSVETLLRIIEYWKNKYGTGIKLGSYYIQLEPHFGILHDFGLFDYKNF